MRLLALIRIFILVLVTGLTTTACQGTGNQSPAASDRTNCRTIDHERGETVVCGQPQRIVVLGPYVLEPLLALDLQPVGFGDHIAFHQEDYTNPSQQIPYLGKQITDQVANVVLAYSPSIEAIVKAQPDLILGIEGNNADQYETLGKIAPTLLLDWAEPETNLRKIGKAVNRTEQAEQQLAQTQAEIAQAQDTFAPLVASHPQVLLLGASSPLKLQLEGSAGLCSPLIQTLGFELVFPPGMERPDANSAIPISIETLPQFNEADIVILFGKNLSESDQVEGMENFAAHQLSDLKQAWDNNAIAQSLEPSKAGRVYFIPAYLCRGLPGVIGTQLYLEELQRQLLTVDHP